MPKKAAACGAAVYHQDCTVDVILSSPAGVKDKRRRGPLPRVGLKRNQLAQEAHQPPPPPPLQAVHSQEGNQAAVTLRPQRCVQASRARSVYLYLAHSEVFELLTRLNASAPMAREFHRLTLATRRRIYRLRMPRWTPRQPPILQGQDCSLCSVRDAAPASCACRCQGCRCCQPHTCSRFASRSRVSTKCHGNATRLF